MIRIFLVGVTVGAFCAATHAASIEHWGCQERFSSKEYWQEYTLADNRMFAPNGKGSWPLVYNSDQVAVAYMRLQKDKSPVFTHIYVLDKRAGKIIWYDDTGAVATEGWSREPTIWIFPCKRLD